MAFQVQFLLRLLQICFSFIVLDQVAYWENDSVASLSTQINFLIFVSSISVLSALYLEVAPILPPKASHPYILFGIEATMSLLYLASFIAVVLPAKLQFCNGIGCMVARVDAVSAALNFVAWTASTTVVGCNIWGLNRKREEAILEEKTIDVA